MVFLHVLPISIDNASGTLIFFLLAGGNEEATYRDFFCHVSFFYLDEASEGQSRRARRGHRDKIPANPD